MPNKSVSDSSAFLENVLPSKIFREQKFRGKNKALNRKIASLTNPLTLNYDPNIDKLVAALGDQELALFQDEQLRHHIKNMSAKTVDIDHLELGLQLTSSDLEKLVDSDDGIERVRTAARQERLHVRRVVIGYKNQGVRNDSGRAKFNYKYRLFVDADDQRYVDVYLSYKKKNKISSHKKNNCIIELIPSRLELHHISLIFAHLNSVLGTRRYQQLLDSANVIRLDTGYNMKGVSQIFTFAGTNNNYFKVGKQLPEENDVSTETTYIGSKRNSHCIVYDKTLKENKFFIENAFKGLRYPYDMVSERIEGINELFLSQIACVRTEARSFFEKGSLYLHELENHRSPLEDLYFIRPKAVMALKPKSRQRLVGNKGLSNIRALLRSCQKRFKGRESSYLLTFDKELASNAFSQRLTELKETIMNPQGDTSFEPSVSVKDHILAARESIRPLVNSIKTRHDPEHNIVSSDASAIYVEGCPGSGKTRLIVERVAHLIASGVNPKHISVLAYTHEASDEFAKRLASAKLPVTDMFVGTFSAWCNQVVLQKNYEVIDPENCLEILTSLVPKKFCDSESFDREDVASAILRVIEHMANFDTPNIDDALSAISPKFFDYKRQIEDVIADFARYKSKRKKASFSDLLTESRKLLLPHKENAEPVRKLIKRVQHLLVDEVQDSNNVQWDILKLYIKEGGQLFCVGDPAQSIYGFRGATTKPLVNFMKIEKAKKFVQTLNSRSVAPVVELSNQVRRAINNKYLISTATRTEGALPRYVESDDLQTAIRWLIKDIKLKLAEGQTDILVLCKYNKQLDIVKEALKKFKDLSGVKTKVRLRALTYHKSKGLEAESCYVLDSTFGTFRHSSVVEERCNLYVAMTRAKDNLTFIASKGGTGLYFETKKGKSKFARIPSILVQLFSPLLESGESELLEFVEA